MNGEFESSVFDLPRSCYVDTVRGVIRARPEDFLVEEELGFEPEGEGEHVYLFLQKRGLNTEHLASELAVAAGVSRRQISYSGMKDRHAVTRQWFSVHLPGRKEPGWQSLMPDAVDVLQQTRHRKKLRRGVHRANRFVIRLTGATGDVELFRHNASVIKDRGVPNYFGEQRFGIQGSNLVGAEEWFSGRRQPRRQQRGHYLSAARSWLFNQVLARRVEDRTWAQLLAGELCMLDGSRSLFGLDEAERDQTQQRLQRGDVHPTGPLYGRQGGLLPGERVLQLEAEVFRRYPAFANGLEQQGLQAERRQLRVIPKHLDYAVHTDSDRWSAELSFTLPRGCFATAVMRELCDYRVGLAGAV